MSPAQAGAAATSHRALAGARWSLLFGNFAIGCGVMVTAGALNDISRGLQVSVALAGQLITISAAVMCVGAPLLAGWVAGFDRRRLLAYSLLWFGIGHLLCALMPSYAALWPVRAVTVLGAAIFTPQAAAAVGAVAPPAERGRSITFIFLGWSLASVFGMPMAAWLGDTFDWRIAFSAVALLSIAGAGWVYAALPDGVRPPALSLASWKEVFTHPVLMPMVAVTALMSAGQFTLFSYFAPYYRDIFGASATEVGLMFAWYGAFGVIGNVLLSRYVDRIGPGRAATAAVAMIGFSLLLWPLAESILVMAIVVIPWAFACFAGNSAQQARLGHEAPALAPALMALNSSAIYLGQAAGAGSGGWIVAQGGYGPLNWVGLAWIVVGIAVSVWVERHSRRAD